MATTPPVMPLRPSYGFEDIDRITHGVTRDLFLDDLPDDILEALIAWNDTHGDHRGYDIIPYYLSDMLKWWVRDWRKTDYPPLVDDLQRGLGSKWLEYHGQWSSSLPPVYFDLLIAALWEEGLQPECAMPPPPDVYRLIGLSEQEVEALADDIAAYNEYGYMKAASAYMCARVRLDETMRTTMFLLNEAGLAELRDKKPYLDVDRFLWDFTYEWYRAGGSVSDLDPDEDEMHEDVDYPEAT